jgi:hypothetical protein
MRLTAKKKWNKGAPLSKKSMGVGRGAGTVKGANGKFMRASDVGMQTVPLPATVEEINNASMADFFASGAYSPPAGGLVLEAVPVPLTSPPTAA